jgi:hypothetical protein
MGWKKQGDNGFDGSKAQNTCDEFSLTWEAANTGLGSFRTPRKLDKICS